MATSKRDVRARRRPLSDGHTTAVDPHDDREIRVTVEKEVGVVKFGEGYKIVAPDGSERPIFPIEACFMLVAGWDESGVFHFTDGDERFSYEVGVKRTDEENKLDSMSDAELQDLYTQARRVLRSREPGEPKEA